MAGWQETVEAFVQHVRSAWVQAEGADHAHHELQLADAEALQPVRRRLHGKQPPTEEDPLEGVVGALYQPALTALQVGGE